MKLKPKKALENYITAATTTKKHTCMQGCGEVLPRALSPVFVGTGYSYEETRNLPASVGLAVLLKVIIALKTILHYSQCSDFTVP